MAPLDPSLMTSSPPLRVIAPIDPSRAPWTTTSVTERGGRSNDKSLTWAVLIFAIALAVVVWLAGRPFTYPLDDAYIHLAIARTLAFHGVWGVQPTDPAAASSSPLFTLILASLFRLAPNALLRFGLYVPFVINVVAAIGLIALWAGILRGHPLKTVALVTLECSMPLFSIALLGMEHVLHVLVVTALAVQTSRSLVADSPTNTVGCGLLALLAALSVMTRYESLFMIGPLMLFAAACRRPRIFLALALGAAIPIGALGFYWMHSGGFFLPNSLMVKRIAPADLRGGSAFLVKCWVNLRANVFSLGGMTLVVTALAPLALVIKRTRLKIRTARSADLLAGATLLADFCQLALAASTGWLDRYEAWLISLNILTLFMLLGDDAATAQASLSLTWAVLAVSLPRALVALTFTVLAVNDRRMEHIAPAEFVAANYPDRTVLINELGAMSYLAQRTTFLDIYGLGNNAPIRYRLAPSGYGRDDLEAWASERRARIGVVNVCWGDINRRLPADWFLVAIWRIPRNVAFRDELVGFLAATRDDAQALAERLRRFARPRSVSIQYFASERVGAALPSLVVSPQCFSGRTDWLKTALPPLR